jgi:uracil-DNA glycosylase
MAYLPVFLGMDVQMEPGWKVALSGEFSKPYFQHLVARLKTERALGQEIYPPGQLIFNAFSQTPLQNVRAVLLGQDPYHGRGQAMGLSFSVPEGVALPPSLQNIYKALRQDVGLAAPSHGNLTAWARQGVLLLNASLTVKAALANSHAQIGWHQFTDAVIATVSAHRRGVVFLLWGSFAHAKAALIDNSKHLILKAPHPSPLSAHKGFFECRHFSKTNEFLQQSGQDPIDWKL